MHIFLFCLVPFRPLYCSSIIADNLSHLKDLRVLNLAGNEITHAKNLAGLNSLTEINLRRNRVALFFFHCSFSLSLTHVRRSQIRSVEDLDTLTNLQRVFISNNQIHSFQQVECVFRIPHLTGDHFLSLYLFLSLSNSSSSSFSLLCPTLFSSLRFHLSRARCRQQPHRRPLELSTVYPFKTL